MCEDDLEGMTIRDIVDDIGHPKLEGIKDIARVCTSGQESLAGLYFYYRACVGAYEDTEINDVATKAVKCLKEALSFMVGAMDCIEWVINNPPSNAGVLAIPSEETLEKALLHMSHDDLKDSYRELAKAMYRMEPMVESIDAYRATLNNVLVELANCKTHKPIIDEINKVLDSNTMMAVRV